MMDIYDPLRHAPPEERAVEPAVRLRRLPRSTQLVAGVLLGLAGAALGISTIEWVRSRISVVRFSPAEDARVARRPDGWPAGETRVRFFRLQPSGGAAPLEPEAALRGRVPPNAMSLPLETVVEWCECASAHPMRCTFRLRGVSPRWPDDVLLVVIGDRVVAVAEEAGGDAWAFERPYDPHERNYVHHVFLGQEVAMR